MAGKKICTCLCIAGLIGFLSGQPGMAELMENSFTYQGMLSEGGHPVSGSRDMIFHLYSDDTCTTGVGGNITRNSVVVSDGVFSVDLDVTPSDFNGQARWIDVQIGEVTFGCQKILPVPYAFTIRPGARIQGERLNWHGLFIRNEAAVGNSYGLWSEAESQIGRGVFGRASSATGANSGVYGKSFSTDGAGVVAEGTNLGADLILAGNANTTDGDDGRISSDPDYSSSDIVMSSNDNVQINLDADGDGEDARFEIYDKDGILLFSVNGNGTIISGGSQRASFPRPAYNSGWVSLSLPDTEVLTHNLGGDIDNYVVDLTCKTGTNISNWGVGGDVGDATEYYGIWWSDLTTTQITVHRWNNDTDCPNGRVRIWIYP